MSDTREGRSPLTDSLVDDNIIQLLTCALVDRIRKMEPSFSNDEIVDFIESYAHEVADFSDLAEVTTTYTRWNTYHGYRVTVEVKS